MLQRNFALTSQRLWTTTPLSDGKTDRRAQPESLQKWSEQETDEPPGTSKSSVELTDAEIAALLNNGDSVDDFVAFPRSAHIKASSVDESGPDESNNSNPSNQPSASQPRVLAVPRPRPPLRKILRLNIVHLRLTIVVASFALASYMGSTAGHAIDNAYWGDVNYDSVDFETLESTENSLANWPVYLVKSAFAMFILVVSIVACLHAGWRIFVTVINNESPSHNFAILVYLICIPYYAAKYLTETGSDILQFVIATGILRFTLVVLAANS